MPLVCRGCSYWIPKAGCLFHLSPSEASDENGAIYNISRGDNNQMILPRGHLKVWERTLNSHYLRQQKGTPLHSLQIREHIMWRDIPEPGQINAEIIFCHTSKKHIALVSLVQML